MISPEENPFVVEFNVRFGDPETQVLMPLLEGGLYRALLACANNQLATFSETHPLNLKKKTSAVHVVLASEGYPQLSDSPMRLNGKILLKEKKNPYIYRFFSGVGRQNGHLVNSGGRVLGITALGSSQEEARKFAYEDLAQISFPGAKWRRDIGLETNGSVE